MDYKDLADHLIEEKCNSFGVQETLCDLIQYGISYDGLLELKFEKDDIDAAYEAVNEAEIDDIINEAFVFTQYAGGDILESEEFKEKFESHKEYVLKVYKPKNILAAPAEFERREKNAATKNDRQSYFLEQCAKEVKAKGQGQEIKGQGQEAKGLLNFSESITNSLGYKEEIENGRENRSE